MPTYSISKGQIDGWELVFAKDKKWHKATSEPADFCYGERAKLRGLIRPFDKNLKYFHDKYYLFKVLNKKNISCIPETYLTFNDFLKNRKNDNSMWFFKLSTYDCGSGVVPFLDNSKDVRKIKHKEIDNACKCKNCERKEYIIQKGVKNLMLYDDRKFDIRIHILITGSGDVYLYKNACMRVSFKKYSLTCNCKRHQLTNGSLGADVQYTDKWSDWERIYPSIKKSVIEILVSMRKYMEKGKYLLIGADFILDKNKKAWALEFNTYPNIYYKEDPQMQPTITHMLKNMLDLLVYGKCEKSTDKVYSWDYVTSLF